MSLHLHALIRQNWGHLRSFWSENPHWLHWVLYFDCGSATLCFLLMSGRCVNMCDVLKPAKAAAVELLKKTDSSFSDNG